MAKRWRVGLLGLGTVNGALATLVAERAAGWERRYGVRLQVVRALVRDPDRPRSLPTPVALCTDPAEVVGAADVDVVVEATGGAEPAGGWLLAALAADQLVVTANKTAVAARLPELLAVAQRTGQRLGIEATVMAGTPVVRTVFGLAAAGIKSMTGVLNGTTTFLADRWAAGVGWEQALAEARERGYAEADPTADLSGQDAADKLVILSYLAWGLLVDRTTVMRQPLDETWVERARQGTTAGLRLRQVAWARRRGRRVEASVLPAVLAPGHAVWAAAGTTNAIALDTVVGDVVLTGPGAGGPATAAALAADLLAAVLAPSVSLVEASGLSSVGHSPA